MRSSNDLITESLKDTQQYAQNTKTIADQQKSPLHPVNAITQGPWKSVCTESSPLL